MDASRDAVARLEECTHGGRGGVILLSPEGAIGIAHNTSGRSFVWTDGGDLHSGIRVPR